MNFGPNPVPEIIDPVFAKTSQNARFLLSENERFGLVFVKTGSINSGTGQTSGALTRVSFASSFDSKQPKPKPVSTLSECFALYRYTQFWCFD